MLSFTPICAAIHTCADTARAKYKIPHSIQRYYVLPKVMKIAPTPNTYLIVQSALSSSPHRQAWAFKKVLHRRVWSLPSTPTFSHRGRSQVEQLNSYNCPAPSFIRRKKQTPYFSSLGSSQQLPELHSHSAQNICPLKMSGTVVSDHVSHQEKGLLKEDQEVPLADWAPYSRVEPSTLFCSAFLPSSVRLTLYTATNLSIFLCSCSSLLANTHSLPLLLLEPLMSSS